MDDYISPTGSDPHAQPTGADSYAQYDPRVQLTRTAPHFQHTGTPSSIRSLGTDAIAVYAKYLRGKYRTGISNFFSHQWPPPPTYKVLKLAMLRKMFDMVPQMR